MHIVINNQVGFTTSDPHDARSTLYCTDVAKMVDAPVFHVNGDDPEAVVFVTRLALEYRKRFRKDVVIDLVCYRRHGHNEADEPAATQPVMYQIIRKHPTARELYAAAAGRRGRAGRGRRRRRCSTHYRDRLESGRPQARASLGMIGNKYTVDWSALHRQVDWTERGRHRRAELKRCSELGQQHHTRARRLHAAPARGARSIDDRRKMAAGELPLDWGFAENLAYATLIDDGYGVRLIGQDSGRGTFFHRHAVLHDQNSDGRPTCRCSTSRAGSRVRR